MARKLKNKLTGIFSRYRLDDRVLQRSDRRIGRPTMYGGEERETGRRVVIKEWRRDPKVDDTDLKEIWREELRQLHRLAGYPGANEHIVMLHDTAEEIGGYYLVLSPGQRWPLQYFIDGTRDKGWLERPRQEHNRLILWQNLKRIAVGLDILHTQGLLHRNLDAKAIFTSISSEPDFQLSGFEWSIRLTNIVENSSRRSGRPTTESLIIHSFLEDWQAFGKLAASLLDIDLSAMLKQLGGKSRNVAADHLIAAERELLVLLLQANSLRRIDGQVVSDQIDLIISFLSEIASRREKKLYITFGLGRASPLSAEIRKISERTIEIEDVDNQLEFIRNDLKEEPLLMAIGDVQVEGGRRFVLSGHSLNYRITAFQARPDDDSTWEVAYCGSIAPQRPAQFAIVGQQTLTGNPIEVVHRNQIVRRLPTLRGKTLHWNQQIFDRSEYKLDDDAARQHRALVLLQLLEACQIASNIWPVVIKHHSKKNGLTILRVGPRSDEERESLSEALGIEAPAKRMGRAFQEEQTAIDGDWKFTDVGILGERDHETNLWQFVEIEENENGEPSYLFEGDGIAPLGEKLFLRQGDFVGQDRLLRRRVRALGALREHTELLAMLADPRIGVRRTHDVISEDEAFKELDVSKRDALKELWSVLPLYLIQGPPGVGKTRLVRELVSRRYIDDPTTRLLMTAQSHHAVDHLLDEVRKGLEKLTGEPPLSLRCRPKGRDDMPGPFDLRQQARKIISDLYKSELVKDAPEPIRSKIDELRRALSSSEEEDEEEEHIGPLKQIDRAFEALLLRSANLVFATTNAGDLERLIEERSQFDWSIIEEAGKATGVEIVAPLLLSHRRLLIGDHKQLPPFGSEQLGKILGEPNRIRKALEYGRALVGRPFRAAGMEDVIDDIDNSSSLTEVCGEAAAVLFLFETIVETELGQGHQSAALPIAKRLSYQHRMHPAIAKLVSTSFYKDALLTDDECVKRYISATPPFKIINPDRLPLSPIIFVDMPYVQSNVGLSNVEKNPRYHNPRELEAVVETLKLLRVNSEIENPPTLAVLSPYREQVRRLHDRINKELIRNLSHISKFSFDFDDGSPVGTVDSFQGSEADIVVISMVRNNHHAGLRALGFLSDPRRMNVLLSRAKWKLILIGSLEFLETRFQKGQYVSEDDPLAFLRHFLDTLTELQTVTNERGVAQASIVPIETLMANSS